MDYLPHAACVTLTSWEIYNDQQKFDTSTYLCIGDVTFMDQRDLKASKTDHPDMESIKLNHILKLCPFTLQTLQNVYTKECTN